MAVVTLNRVKPVGPVLGRRRAKRMEGNPPAGGPSCRTGRSFTDCRGRARAVGQGVRQGNHCTAQRTACVEMAPPTAVWQAGRAFAGCRGRASKAVRQDQALRMAGSAKHAVGPGWNQIAGRRRSFTDCKGRACKLSGRTKQRALQALRGTAVQATLLPYMMSSNGLDQLQGRAGQGHSQALAAMVFWQVQSRWCSVFCERQLVVMACERQVLLMPT